jgi:hypothetical protein
LNRRVGAISSTPPENEHALSEFRKRITKGGFALLGNKTGEFHE